MLKTFPKGGIHPNENKITAAQAIKRLPVPKVVYVPIAQHIGIPSEIVVDRKDQVDIGQGNALFPVAHVVEAEEALGPVHALAPESKYGRSKM